NGTEAHTDRQRDQGDVRQGASRALGSEPVTECHRSPGCFYSLTVVGSTALWSRRCLRARKPPSTICRTNPKLQAHIAIRIAHCDSFNALKGSETSGTGPPASITFIITFRPGTSKPKRSNNPCMPNRSRVITKFGHFLPIHSARRSKADLRLICVANVA